MTHGTRSDGDIDIDARTLMRDRAARRGVTVAPDDLRGIAPIGVAGWDDQGDVRRLSAELDRLSQKLESSQQRVARNVGAIDKAIVTIMSKVEQSGLAQVSALERVNRVVGELQNAQAALQQRIETMEGEARTGPALNALKDLEAALGRLSENVRQAPTAEDVRELEDGLRQLAENVQARHSAQEREQAGIRELVEGRVSEVSNRVEGLSRSLDAAIQGGHGNLTERMQALESQVSQTERKMDAAIGRMTDTAARFEMLESKAERSVNDATWRMERAIDTSLTRSRALSQDLSDRVDTIEGKTRDAVNAMSDAVSRIVDRLGRMENGQDSAIKALDRSISAIEERLSRGGGEAAQEMERIQSSLQQRLDSLNGEFARSIHTIRVDVEQRLEQAARSNQPEKLERLERMIRTLQEKIAESEARQADAVDEMSLQMERMARAVEERLKLVETRDPSKSVEEVRREVVQFADRIESRVSGMEAEARAANQTLQSLRGEIGRVGAQSDDRLRDLDQRSARAIQGIGEQVEAVADRMHRRHEADMQSTVERMQETIRDVQRGASEDIHRLAERVNEVADAAKKTDPEAYATLVDRFDERVRDSERRSADAIGQIGEQVARAAERLQAQQAETLRTLNDKLGESGRHHEMRLHEALADISRRMDEIGDQASSSLTPIHNTVASLARRMSALEDEALPGGARTGSFDSSPPSELSEDMVFDDRPAAGEVFDIETATDTPDVVGVEPPPYDLSPDAHLFVEDPSLHAQATEAPPAPEEKPARAVAAPLSMEDMLEIDEAFTASPASASAPAAAASEFVADLPGALAPGRGGPRYLDQARKAAQHANRSPFIETDVATGKRGIGKGPLVASAAIAIAVAGGGAYAYMRGKQDPSADTGVRTDPAAPVAAEGDAKAAAAVLFGDDSSAADPSALRPGDAARGGPEADLFAAQGAEAAEATPGATTVEPLTLAEAVDDGDPVALYDQALEYLQTGEKTRAVAMLKDAASRGLVVAKYRLGKLYESGEGVPRDMAAARTWTEQAATAGNVKAMHDLAVFYAEGDAGPQSYAAAVEWFRQASEHGLVDSQYNLAVLYDQGLGVSIDKAEAAFWFEVAGRAGDPDAARRARALLAELAIEDADIVKRRARAYNAKAPNPRANGALGSRPWEVLSTAQAAELQRLLSRLGYAPGEANGRLGESTSQAIRAFEHDFGLPPSGDATVSLLRKLRSAALTAN